MHRSPLRCSRLIPLLALSLLALAATAGPAAAETITGRFRYLDSDGTLRPIAFAEVHIRRGHPTGFFDYWDWGTVATTVADGDGRVSVNVPFASNQYRYEVVVWAKNYAADVLNDNFFSPGTFGRRPGEPGPGFIRAVSSPGDVLDFTFDFTDVDTTKYFNLAETVRRGFDYAAAHRAPGEVDVVPRVGVHPNNVTGTFYNPTPIYGGLMMATPHVFEDFVILHEYAHFLEHQIGQFMALPTVHDGCRADLIVDMTSAQHAWMEGFAEYFARAVERSLPPGILSGTPDNGTFSVGTLENRLPCSGHPGADTESFVASVLWDLVDAPTEPGAAAEPFDRYCGKDDLIFQIFDRDLDVAGVLPTIFDFWTAALAAGIDRPGLAAIFAGAGIAVPAPIDIGGYDTGGAADLAAYAPGFSGSWSIQQRPSGAVSSLWLGSTGDVPVSADFDGDGRVDAAVFDGDSGTWFLRPSGAGGAIVPVQWGTAGDVPVPDDYDGDGEAEVAIFRPSDGTYWVLGDQCGGTIALAVGYPGEVAAPGDYDGDHRTDLGLYNPSNGVFWAYNTLTGGWINGAAAGDVPVSADYDGDGRDDMAAYSFNTGIFHVRESTTGILRDWWWGLAGEKPVPADYDGDGRADVATYDPALGNWWIRASTTGTTIFQSFGGAPGHIPVVAR